MTIVETHCMRLNTEMHMASPHVETHCMRLKTASKIRNAHGVLPQGDACNAIYKETHAKRDAFYNNGVNGDV